MKRSVIIFFLMAHSATFADTLFVERFDDPNLLQRGWYDFSSAKVDSTVATQGSASLACHFALGATTPTPVKVLRRQFTPTTSVYLRYFVRYSANWTGSNKPYHPHEFNITTNADNKYVGPAWTHLTTYIEHNEGVPLLALQDGRNINVASVRQDISNSTQDRSTCGCNGTLDNYPTDCYNSGTEWRNGKQWRASQVWFADQPGARYKNDWHKVEAYFQLNTIENGKGLTNGVVQYWYDDSLLINKNDVEMRTAMQPLLAFNQILVAPYIGDGSPVAQSMWIDDLVLGTKRTPPLATSVVYDFLGSNGTQNYEEETVVGVYDLYGRHVAGSINHALIGVYIIVYRTPTGTIKSRIHWTQ